MLLEALLLVLLVLLVLPEGRFKQVSGRRRQSKVLLLHCWTGFFPLAAGF